MAISLEGHIVAAGPQRAIRRTYAGRVGISQDVKIVLACSLSAALGVALLGTPIATSAANAETAAVLRPSTEGAVASLQRSVDSTDPANWSNTKLASRLMLVGVYGSGLGSIKPAVRKGLGGIVLFGAPPSNLGKQLAALRASAPGDRLLVSSDEEGGMVQRLTRLTGKMPTAKRIGQTMTPAQTQAYAYSYGKRLKALGVGTNLAPVADLKYPGSWTDRDGRAYKANPAANGRYVAAFARGMQAAGVMATVKHWPGGGAVVDTHKSAGKTPLWSSLLRRDLVPFRTAFAAGVGAMMISHAKVPGLSRGLPATQSAAALREARAQAGDRTLIVTDSLMMAAVTSAMRQSQSRAAVRALAAGADLALIQGNSSAARKAIADAIANGTIPRAQAIASARRVITAQQSWG